jgi:hypothetical protein
MSTATARTLVGVRLVREGRRFTFGSVEIDRQGSAGASPVMGALMSHERAHTPATGTAGRSMWIGRKCGFYTDVPDGTERDITCAMTESSSGLRPPNALPFSCKPAAEPASRFYTMSLRRD